MQYLVIAAAQDPTYDHQKEHDGVYVGCWIKNQTETNARIIAKGWIEESGWVPLSVDEQHPVTADTYAGNHDARKYFEQALIDEEVFVFNTFPKNQAA